MSAAAFVVPTRFTAVDAVTATMRSVSSGAVAIGNRFITAAKGVGGFNGLMKETGSQLLSFLSTAALAAAIISGIYFSADSLMVYEKALASFRTIVSDATDKEFAGYRAAIQDTANVTRKSAIEVAASFEKIAGLNAAFAATPAKLQAVSTAAITLAKASGDDLGSAATSLVGIMNQFNLGAEQSNRTINVLAAGQAAGAASITQTSEAFVNFGAVAKSANITLEQSVALVQTLGSKSIFGAEAGTKLRGAVLQLQKAGVGYASGQFQINDALADTQKKFNALTTAKQKDAFLLKVFGAENITTGKILMDNIATFQNFTTAVTGTSEAQKAAAINSDTLSNRIDELKAAWVNMLVSNNGANDALSGTKTAVVWLTDNLPDIVKWTVRLTGAFIAYKAIVIGAAIWTGFLALAQGISAGLGFTQETAFIASTAGLWGYELATKAATAKTWLFNAACAANPIGLIVIAILAFIAVIAILIYKWDEWGASVTAVFGIFFPYLALAISVVQSFRRNWDMIVEAFKSDGIIGGIKAIGKTLLDVVLMPLQQILGLVARFTGAQWATNAAASIASVRTNMGLADVAPAQGGTAPIVDANAARQDAMESNINQSYKENLTFDFKNMPAWMQVNKGSGSAMSMVNPSITSTLGN